jgi:hypothetical protein
VFFHRTHSTSCECYVSLEKLEKTKHETFFKLFEQVKEKPVPLSDFTDLYVPSDFFLETVAGYKTHPFFIDVTTEYVHLEDVKLPS